MHSIDTSVPVVVLKVIGGRLPHGGVGVVRSLGRLDVPVYVIHEDRGAALARSRYVREQLAWPLERAPQTEWVERLLQLSAQIGRPAILIPTDDVGTLFLYDHAGMLRDRFVFPEQPPGLPRSLSSKNEMHVLCERFGVPTPEVVLPGSRSDVERFVEDATFPVVAKSIDPQLLVRRPGAHSVFIAQSAEDLLSYYDLAEVPGQPNLLLQEYIPGGPETVWMFNGYFDERSDCLMGATGQKLRQHPPYTGMSTLGVCRRNDRVDWLARDFMKAIGYRGILDIGFRHDVRDGEYKLLDVNPRVGATFRLFVGTNGMDVVRALYLDLTGQPVPPTSVREGRKWILETHDPVSCLTYVRDGRLSLGGWLRSLRGIEEGALFAWDDPFPFLSVGWRLMRKVLGRGAWLVRRKALPSVGREPHEAAPRVARPTVASGDGQGRADRLVEAKFQSAASFWEAIHRRKDVVGAVYGYRRVRALDWAEGLGLPSGSRALEVGCGPGLVAIDLARSGFVVEAVDTTPAMVELATHNVSEAGLSGRVRVTRGDAHALPFPAEAFDLAVALGVIPWLSQPTVALQEMARVLKPGGYLVISADNRRRITHYLDPLRNPVLTPAKEAVKAALARLGLRRALEQAPRPSMHRPEEFDLLLSSTGLEKERGETFGFGPFTVMHRSVLPARAGRWVHRRLQSLADGGTPWLRSAGTQYLVLARRTNDPRR